MAVKLVARLAQRRTVLLWLCIFLQVRFNAAYGLRSQLQGARLSTARNNLATEERAGLTGSHARIDVYVINLDSRPDRCQCMSSQLAMAPHPVYRQHAVTDALECPLGADLSSMYGKRDHQAEFRLFCSNYKIWQRANASSTEYILVFEDDAILSVDFWDQVHNLIDGCQDFDYIVVDSWNQNASVIGQKRDSVLCAGRDTRFFRPSTKKASYWGTAAQLIRRSYLDTLIRKAQRRGMGPMDVWWFNHLKDGRTFAWMPNIVIDAVRTTPAHLERSGCNLSVNKSDIDSAADFLQLSKTRGGRTELPRLQCN